MEKNWNINIIFLIKAINKKNSFGNFSAKLKMFVAK